MSIARPIGGLFALDGFLVACAPLVLLSLIVPDEWRGWPLLTIWISLYTLRLYHHDRQLKTDCAILALLAAWRTRLQLLELAARLWQKPTVDLLHAPYSAFAIATLFAALLSLWLPRVFKAGDAAAARLPAGTVWTSDIQVPKPRIFPCQTTHARIFPKRHAFAYSYLQCGYPIVPSGIKHGEINLPSGEDQTLGPWWLRVRAEDYLERGHGAFGFYYKLQKYLVTAPRFFGYAFNPVSFWYIYDRHHQLTRMILEVNNTFGERRMYLLDGSSPSSPPRTPDSHRSLADDGSESEANGAKSNFSDVWMKDFHVSPFNSRKGSYALKAQDPFPTVGHGDPRIDNTITLKSSKDYGKLVARLFSTGTSLDPDQLGLVGTARFVLSWWWVGLVTFPRILREAGKLFFKRKLHVWFRPEVLTSSIGRLPTSDEIALQLVFQDYLRELVNQTEYPFRITFQCSIPDEQPEIIFTTRAPEPDRPQQNMEIRVLTPAFYSRLIHYTYTSEAIDRECIFTDERNRTLWICRPKLLPLLLSERSSICIEDEDKMLAKRSYLDELRWALLKKLRCPPCEQAYSVTPQSSEAHVDDIRSRPYSELDGFVRSSMGQKHAGPYRRTVTKLLLAQRFCFGFPEIVGLVDVGVRVLLCYWAVVQMKHWSVSWAGAESAKCMSGLVSKDWSACPGVRDMDGLDWWRLATSVASISALHAYGLLKGYG